MIVATKIRKGMLLKVDGELYRVHDYTHVTPGKGNAIMQTKLKNLKTGSISDFRFRPSDKVERASLENRPMEYLYQDGDHFVFMDTQTYEQTSLEDEMIGEAMQYLKANQEITVEFYDGRPIGIELPKTVELEVTECDPGMKSATVTNVGKPCTLETGLIITAPQFVEKGDILVVDTEENRYVERKKK